jgi:hypothetical protein
MARTKAYDVLVRVTVTARDRETARTYVEAFLPDPANEDNQPKRHTRRTSNYPVDSWALLTGEKVIDVDANAKRDRVTWQAIEVS